MNLKVSELLNPQEAYEKGYRDFADCICSLIDREGGDGPSLYNWSGQTPSAESVAEHLEQLIELRCRLSRQEGKREAESFFEQWLTWQSDRCNIYPRGAGDVQSMRDFVKSWRKDLEDMDAIKALASLEQRFSEIGEIAASFTLVRERIVHNMSAFCQKQLPTRK